MEYRGLSVGGSCGCSAGHKLNSTYNVSNNSMGVSVPRRTDGIAMAKPVGITTHVDRSDKTVNPVAEGQDASYSSLPRGIRVRGDTCHDQFPLTMHSGPWGSLRKLPTKRKIEISQSSEFLRQI